MLFTSQQVSLFLRRKTRHRLDRVARRESRRRKPNFLPRVEQLEDRTLLSVTVEAISRTAPSRVSITAALNSTEESISADGRFVAFQSNSANLVPGDNNGAEDVFVRDTLLGTTTLVSVNDTGTGSANASANNGSGQPVISANGRFVAFFSDATDLVPNLLTNGLGNVYLRDLWMGTTTLVSVNAAGTAGGNNNSAFNGGLTMTPDGRFVVFTSYASDLVATPTNNHQNVFVRDMQTGVTQLVSINQAGTQSADNDSFISGISDNGRTVVFTSAADDIVPNDTNFTYDVFAYDMPTGKVALVSVNAAGTGTGNSDSTAFVHGSVVSSDGRFVAFESDASDLVPNDTNGQGDVFVRDLVAGTTTLVSVNASGTASGNSFSRGISISSDGSRVAFTSRATDLTTGVTGDIYVRDLTTQTTTVVDVSTTGGQANSDSDGAAISADGNSVLFSSRATNLIPRDDQIPGRDTHIYLRNLQLGQTAAMDANRDNSDPSDGTTFDLGVVTPDGKFVAYFSGADDIVAQDTNFADDVFERDVFNARTNLVSQRDPGLPNLMAGGNAFSVSADGRFVAFAGGPNNAATGVGIFGGIYVRDRQSGKTISATVGFGGAGPNDTVANPGISADGRYVVFETRATNLVDTRTAFDNVYRRDLLAGHTVLVSVNFLGHGADSDSFNPVISADGRFVVFQSFAQDLVKIPPGQVGDHLYERDMLTGKTSLVDINLSGTASGNGPIDMFEQGIPGNGAKASISSDGRYIAFESYASDLTNTSGFPSGQSIYVRDMVAKVTTLVSVDITGTMFANGFGSSFPVITPDGSHVAFYSSATNLTNDVVSNFNNLFVRDLSAGVTKLVNVNLSGQGDGVEVFGPPSISDDGNRLAFVSAAGDLVPDDTNGVDDVFVRDVAGGTTFLVSVNSSGTNSGNASSSAGQISADGRRVVFDSAGTDLVPNVTTQGNIYLRDLAAGTTILLSPNRFGTDGSGGCNSGTLSQDGNTAVFLSVSPDLVANDFDGTYDVFAVALSPAVSTPLVLGSLALSPAALDAVFAHGSREALLVTALTPVRASPTVSDNHVDGKSNSGVLPLSVSSAEQRPQRVYDNWLPRAAHKAVADVDEDWLLASVI
jgi:hypothetical protein